METVFIFKWNFDNASIVTISEVWHQPGGNCVGYRRPTYVFGSLGEASEAVHSLVEALTTSRVQVAGPQKERRGVVRSEEGEKSIAVGYIRRTLSLAGILAWQVGGFGAGVHCSNWEEE